MRRYLVGLWIGLGALPAYGQSDCTLTGEPPTDINITWERVATGLRRPVAFTALSDTHVLVVEQPGRVQSVRLSDGNKTMVLDITGRVDSSRNEMGLLGMTLHPQFEENGRIFFNYTRGSFPNRFTQISEFRWVDDRIDPDSERRILNFRQPYSNHNGGDVVFGPDGYLYIASGDGGDGGDPDGHGQNLGTLLGAILRIDVDSTRPYAIPADNPFIDTEGAMPEIYAYGLRNPWRISFDPITGALWAADVGQNAREEINIIKNGGNYGWRPVEGDRCFERGCDLEAYDAPIHAYPRSQGASITGGYVYRGTAIPTLVGQYVYADYESRRVWSLKLMEDSVDVSLLQQSSFDIAGFGQDKAGELYILNHEVGEIHKLMPGAIEESTFPLRLSETGCFESLAPLRPVADFVGYDVNSPLWSDGLDKDRYVKVPGDEKIGYSSTEPWAYPMGTIFIKQFRQGDTAVETRFMVKKADGFKGYSYRWLDDGSDAIFIGETTSKDLPDGDGGSFTYDFPSQGDCARCHNRSQNEVMGFRLEQLNRPHEDTNFITHLGTQGLFRMSELPDDFSSLTKWVDPSDTEAGMDMRARSWMAVQCAACHNEGNAGNQANFDLSYDLSLAETGLCFGEPRHGEMGVEGAKAIIPGEPDRSLMFMRSATLEAERMPAVASNRLDMVGINLLRDWITGLDCP